MESNRTVIPITALPPLSFSSMSTFRQCPHQYLRTRILKDVKGEGHPSAVWGSDVHKALENYLRDGKPLPKRFRMFQEYADALDGIGGERFVEVRLAVTEDMQPTEFFDKSAKYIGIVDYIVIRGDTAFMIDHKSGKIKPSDQLALCALMAFAKWPELQTIKAAFYWMKHTTYTKYEYKREQMADLDSRLFSPTRAAVRAAAQQGLWVKKSSGLCPWCPVTDCEFHNKR